MNTNTVEQIIEKSKSLGLMGLEYLIGFDIEDVCKAYNGIGPQFLPEKLRNKVTEILHIFEPAALVHDLRFEQSNGTRTAFDYANCEFFVNCHKCAKAQYRWWNWKRYRAYAVIDAMNEFNCSDRGGWKAWLDSYESKRK